jgi:hypothetical protein
MTATQTRERSAPTGRPSESAPSKSTATAGQDTAEVVDLWDPQAIAGRAYAKYGPRSHSIICEWQSLVDFAEYGPAFAPGARIPEVFLDNARRGIAAAREASTEARERQKAADLEARRGGGS